MSEEQLLDAEPVASVRESQEVEYIKGLINRPLTAITLDGPSGELWIELDHRFKIRMVGGQVSFYTRLVS